MIPDETTTKEVLIQNNTEALARPRQWLLAKLKDYEYCEDDIFAVRLAMEEAFFNAVKHGNKMDAQKQVKIEYILAPDRVEIIITDSGEGFDPDSLPDCRADENLYKIDGRGIFLIRAYMDSVEFNETANSIHMIRYRHEPKDKTSAIA